jgi:hypothetical protein
MGMCSEGMLLNVIVHIWVFGHKTQPPERQMWVVVLEHGTSSMVALKGLPCCVVHGHRAAANAISLVSCIV